MDRSQPTVQVRPSSLVPSFSGVGASEESAGATLSYCLRPSRPRPNPPFDSVRPLPHGPTQPPIKCAYYLGETTHYKDVLPPLLGPPTSLPREDLSLLVGLRSGTFSLNTHPPTLEPVLLPTPFRPPRPGPLDRSSRERTPRKKTWSSYGTPRLEQSGVGEKVGTDVRGPRGRRESLGWVG